MTTDESSGNFYPVFQNLSTSDDTYWHLHDRAVIVFVAVSNDVPDIAALTRSWRLREGRRGGGVGVIFLGIVFLLVLGWPGADDRGRSSELPDLLDDVDGVCFSDDGRSALGRVEDNGGYAFYGGHHLHHLPPPFRAEKFR